MILYYFMYLFHHKYLVYNYSANGETDEPLFKTIREVSVSAILYSVLK